ncbi:hypothetical protein FHS42_004821 [Streptomyces zagrosensis]|uniref:Uncharacterized protein n=1 Tax=Streptomyces zagrosensis TaxID=1042984 RepID=A0A7W9QEH0_9ACTN|nr:hypothetical protein [Streptomyces zagrosensis]
MLTGLMVSNSWTKNKERQALCSIFLRRERPRWEGCADGGAAAEEGVPAKEAAHGVPYRVRTRGGVQGSGTSAAQNLAKARRKSAKRQRREAAGEGLGVAWQGGGLWLAGRVVEAYGPTATR